MLATMYPGAVSCHIQAVPVASQPSPNAAPSQKRCDRLGTTPSPTSNSAIPTNDSGHHPHGGSDNATSSPAASARGIRARTDGEAIDVGLCHRARRRTSCIVT